MSEQIRTATNVTPIMARAIAAERLATERLASALAAEERAEKAELGRDELTATLVKLFAWEDTSFIHAVLHVENAVLNQRADLSAETRRAEKAARERDEAKELARVLTVEMTAAREECSVQVARALTAERERDEARRLHSEAEAQVACRSELRAQLDTLRAELARLTAPAEGERARQQPAQGRATDEELFALFREVRSAPSEPDASRAVNNAVLAVAARVRQECLVAQAVGMGASLEIGPHSRGVDIHVSRPREDADGGEHFEGELVEAGRDDVPAADVPATLARLLGEVAR